MNLHEGTIVLASFLASSVEFVEALTIVLVVGVTVNWKSSLWGAAAAIGLLLVLIVAGGAALVTAVPLVLLRLIVGILLVLFGLKWMKKAILRYAGVVALHDEEAIFERESAELRAHGVVSQRFQGFGFAVSFKSVLLEGLEVAFIVVTMGASSADSGHGWFWAGLGAAVALLTVLVVGAAARRPLQKVPENTLKFVVGLMLTTFGTFWGGEGLGISWWGGDAALVGLAVFYLAAAGLLVRLFQREAS